MSSYYSTTGIVSPTIRTSTTYPNGFSWHPNTTNTTTPIGSNLITDTTTKWYPIKPKEETKPKPAKTPNERPHETLQKALQGLGLI